jgi:hypothetical protein
VGFGPACAPVRCAHPSFWSHCHAQRGAARPPAYRSFAAFIYPPKFSLRSELGRQGRISFPWAKLHPTEQHCILMSYAAPSWAPLHPTELHCTLLRYAVPLRYAAFDWVTLHPIWAKLRPKSYAAISELSWALLSYTAPLWATLHPTELCLTLNELRGTLKKYNVPITSQLPWSLRQIMVCRESPAKISVWQKIRQSIPLLL